MQPARTTASRSTLAPFVGLVAVGLAACGGGGGGGGGSQNPPTGPTPVASDLVAEELVVAEANVVAGQEISVSLRARNLGPEAAPAFRMGVYLSTDEAHDAADRRLGFWSVSGLAAGAATSAGGSLTVPLQTTAGAWRVLLVVDDVALLTEPVESNNVLAAAGVLAVAPPTLADLAPVAASFQPFSVMAGNTIEVSDSVENAGVSAAGAFRVGVYLSADPVVTTQDVLIGYRTLVSLAPGARDDAVGDVTVPVSLTAGNYHVGVIVDDQDAVTEANEGDNVAVAGVALEVTPAPTTDLVGVAIAFNPSVVNVGATLAIEETARNDGLIPAGAFQVGVYLSQDVDLDPAEDVLLGFRTVPSLAPGAATASGTVDLVVPTTVTAGMWFVGALVDHTNLVADSNRLNNAVVALAQVEVRVPPLPDLVAAEVSFSPSAVQPGVGGVLQVDQLVRNLGQYDAGGFRVGVYLSDNAVISPSDVLLGTRTLASLAAGASSGAGSGFALPGGLSPGTYYVALIVDDLDEQAELSEGNNLLLATGTLDVTNVPTPMPDLVMEVVDPGANQTAPGGAVQIVSRVKNEGTASASGDFRVGFYLSVDETITTDDIFLGSRLVPFGLGIGFTSVASVPVTIPGTVAEGTYHLGAFADSTLAITESDESDNGRAASGTFTIEVPRPNLRVTALAAPPAALTLGGTFDVTHTVRNSGAAAAGAFRVGIYLSSDTTLDRATDVLIGSRNVASLSMASNSADVTPVTIPTTLAPGTYHLAVYVDDLEAIGESDEGDNSRVTNTTTSVN